MLLAASAVVLFSTAAGYAAPHYPTTGVLWDQNANFGGGVNSQNYEQAMVEYDDIAADDFVVPSGQTWRVSEVDVTGAYVGGSGPATSVNVGFWKNGRHGMPGRGRYGYTLSCADNAGSFQCTLPNGRHNKPAVKLVAGTWWLSVVANCDSDVCGQWQWTENTTVQGYEAEWENPGGAWNIFNCHGWTALDACFGGSPADLAFTLKGYSQSARSSSGILSRN